jgi:hypothetical protein
MSDQDDWEFAGPDDAKAEIRAAVGYLLRGATGGARGDIVQEIIAIVRQVASGLPPEQGESPGWWFTRQMTAHSTPQLGAHLSLERRQKKSERLGIQLRRRGRKRPTRRLVEMGLKGKK